MNGRDNGYDVIVVGGRVAGAPTAMLLARAGLRVALVERSAYGSDTLSTHGLMRAGVMQLARWNLLPRLVAAGTPAINHTVFHYAAERSVGVSIRPGPGVPALYAPRRHLLDRLLVDAAVEAGADVHHEQTVTDLLPDRESAGRVGGVTVKSRDGRTRDLWARFTIGADGIRSVVADRAGAPVVRQARSASAVSYRYLANVETEGYEWAYGAGCATGLIPTNDGLTCVFVSTTGERMRALRAGGVDAAFAALVARSAPGLVDRVGAGSLVGRARGFSGVRGFVRRPWGPGWALVGDAGYFKDPITAHGMTDALRDAELLSCAVVQALGNPRHESGALHAYERTRDTLSSRLFAATDAVAAYDWDIPTIEGLLRQVSSAMSDEVDYLQQLPEPFTAGVVGAENRPDSLEVAG